MLVSVMTFSKGNISRKSKGWEIDRFASLMNTSVIGGASKLWEYFLNHYMPDIVVSYADNRWSNGNLYKTLNFQFEKTLRPTIGILTQMNLYEYIVLH